MDINELKEIIEKINYLPKPKKNEVTLFSVGGRGYFENPTTDILAFFCNESAEHDLDNIVLQALFDVISEKDNNVNILSEVSLSDAPMREVTTHNGKRIDLILQGNDWVMVIENKIFHQQINPFSEYKEYVNRKSKNMGDPFYGKSPIFVVISPSGSSPDGWVGVPYKNLIDSIWSSLSRHFIENPLSKWVVLLRDFLIHLESIMSNPSVPIETIEYILSEIPRLKKAKEIEENSIKNLQKIILDYVSIEMGVEISTSLEFWHGFPSLRYFFPEFKRRTDVALFLDGREGKRFCLNFYVYGIKDSGQRSEADGFFAKVTGNSDLIRKIDKSWDESKYTIRCYKQELPSYGVEQLKKYVLEKLQQLRCFEDLRRSKK